MQCTSYTPVYYHARDLNAGAGGYSWHLYDGNGNNGEERGYSVSMPSCDQYLGYDKEMLKQIIQNHEATFRYQVQELHRLYRRQRDLMDEMRVREIFEQHLLSRTSESIHSSSHAGDEISQKPSPAADWLLGNLSSRKLSELTSGNVRGPQSFVAENFQKPTALQTDDVKFLLSPITKRHGNEIVDLANPAYMHHDDRVKQFKAGPELTCRTPEKIFDFQPATTYSDIGSTKTWDLSSSSSGIRKTCCFIDLNEPIQLESLPASSSGPLEAFTGHSETVCSDERIPVKATPESRVPSRENSDGTNSSMLIDLNSLPVNCFSETEMTFGNPPSINREAKIVLDSVSEDEPIVHDICDSFLKTESRVDLNTGVADEHPLPPSSSALQKKSAEDTELKGPVSPENEERSPPRGESEDIQMGTPLSFEQGEAEPFIELDTTAAQTLVMIFSSGVEEPTGAAAALEPLANFRNLCWFAEIVSSTGDEVGDEVMKLETDATAENDQGEQNAVNTSRFSKGKGTGSASRRTGKGQKRGKKQRKGFKSEEALEFPEIGPLKRKPGRSSCAKQRKHPKLSPSDVMKKSMSSILKQSAASSDHGVVQNWGRTRKRQGGRTRSGASQFSLIS
ncbi:uncharacterized protein LOC131008852 [Salvia miltiorrhiza]|uniref:uncharacterized protein LOC131008852 n=1 Tax=Salvia miltiorrhiza TaxID=226208 RepID=UPI0025AC2D93|nr:uncharacterized protein LOC131008852 [Salvia miltiorrhiza]XP_057791923.1 uncharacterized protein LOC131008852 [Salvia miltiorrhiza]XP_057791924.1 uncharacterized protein LOC131008852 [Salvia miltiorrhiza]XP_057791925.1 uncharacterized protein LOC131008852 [Salvia miltiorrhiza]XP_057791926.1 uncharacterized protein LOC131008852 [Salvia miltiorrhiza]XP_057791927.1 uncharacterized protein LOC131008852 [Salvia miltiorrhiza]